MAFLTFSIDVRVPEPSDEVLADLVTETEAQADQFVSALNDILSTVGAERVSDYYIGDPAHPPNRECQCDGPEGWHCTGEDATHWADTDGVTCGHCGFAPDAAILASDE